jgi:hypothetical protein
LSEEVLTSVVWSIFHPRIVSLVDAPMGTPSGAHIAMRGGWDVSGGLSWAKEIAAQV